MAYTRSASAKLLKRVLRIIKQHRLSIGAVLPDPMCLTVVQLRVLELMSLAVQLLPII
jgi:hypothetical protein